MPRFCTNCGNPLRENSRFCPSCGKQVFSQPALQNNFPQNNIPYSQTGFQKEKNRHTALKVFLAIACIGLVAAGVIFMPNNIKTPMLGKFRKDSAQTPKLTSEQKAEYARINSASEEKSPQHKAIKLSQHDYGWLGGKEASNSAKKSSDDENLVISKENEAFASGHSKSFKIKPVKGVTISAKKNALDSDRKFIMEELDAEKTAEISETYEKNFAEEKGFVLKCWHLDAGLKDDEILPKSFTMDFDLKEMGVPENLYDCVRFYRVDNSGKWYEYAAGRNKNIASVESRQNSVIVSAIGITVFSILMPQIIDSVVKWKSDGYFLPSLRFFSLDKVFLKVDGKERFQILIKAEKIKKMLNEIQALEDAIYVEATKKAAEVAIEESEFSDDIKRKLSALTPQYMLRSQADELIKDFLDTTKSYPKERKKFRDFFILYRAQYIASFSDESNLLESSDEIRKSIKNLKEDEKTLENLRKNIEAVNQIAKYLEYSWFFLKDNCKLSMFDYTMEIHLTEGDGSAYGVANPVVFGNPFMNLYMEMLTDGKNASRVVYGQDGMQASYDELLLTIVHEMFHAVQREYVHFTRTNIGFDELSAQALEEEAFDYFSKKKDKDSDKNIISTPRETHLENLNKVSYFAIPLNEYFTSYPENPKKTIGETSSSKRAEACYPRAPFFRYMKKKYPATWGEYMTRYKRLPWDVGMAGIFRNIFPKGKYTNEDLSSDWNFFAYSYQTEFYKAAKDGDVDAVFAPVAEVGRKRAEVKVVNKDFTVRVRRVKIDRPIRYSDKYALVLKRSEGFNEKIDLDVEPIGGMFGDKDYLTWDDDGSGTMNYFFQPKDIPDDLTKPVLYLMEIDGGLSKEKEATSSYSIVMLSSIYDPDADKPLMEREEYTLTMKPLKLDDYKKDVVDSIAVTFLLDGKELATEQILYDGWKEDWTYDLTKLKSGLQKLSEGQLLRVQVLLRECVKGTFASEARCLGPGEAFPLPEGETISGTYNVSINGDYTLPMVNGVIDKIVGFLQKAVGDQKTGSEINSYGKQIKDEMDKALSDIRIDGKMTIKPLNKKNKYEVIFKGEKAFQGGKAIPVKPENEQGDPTEVFSGTYNPSKKQMTLKRVKAARGKSSEGLSINLSDYGAGANVNLTFKSEKNNKTGKKNYTFKGESKQKSKMVTSDMSYDGKKISDEIIELK